MKNLSDILKDNRNVGYIKNGVDEKTINEFETAFGIRLPKTYRNIVLEYGTLGSDEWLLLGLGGGEDVLDLHDAAEVARESAQPGRFFLLPIEFLGFGETASLCLSLNSTPDDVPVVLWNTRLSPEKQPFEELASFSIDYVVKRVAGDGAFIEKIKVAVGRQLEKSLSLQEQSAKEIAKAGLQRLEYHVNRFNDKFGYTHDAGGKLPKSHDWRPYRYCVQDVVLGTIVLRHSREQNLLEVDVFMTTEHPDFPKHHGTRGLAGFALTEAFHCGGTMDIQFTDYVLGGRIPPSLVNCAESLGVVLGEDREGRMTPPETRALYLALTPFSDSLREYLRELGVKGLLQPERACYLVHHGVWSPTELEAIVRSSAVPERILSGSVSAVLRHPFQEDLLEARAALLGGFLDRKLAYRGKEVDLEDDVRQMVIGFDGKYRGKIYTCEEDFPLPWVVPEVSNGKMPIMARENPFHILVRARDAGDILLSWRDDITASLTFANGEQAILLYPNDFWLVADSVRMDICREAKRCDLLLITCPESTKSLDNQAIQRLERSRITRQ